MKNFLKRKVLSRSNMKKLGQEAVDTIVTRTQVKGKGTEDGKLFKLKSLEKSTIARRKRFKNLSSKTKPRRSNLTMTGQMLDNIIYRVRGKRIIVLLKGSRNRKVATFVQKVRPFFNLSKREFGALLKLLKNNIRRF